MNTKLSLAIIISILLAANVLSQGMRPGAPPPPPRPERHDQDWMRGIDANRNGMIEADEFQAAIDRTFAHLDRNSDGVIDKDEVLQPPEGHRMGPPRPPRDRTQPGMPGQRPSGPQPGDPTDRQAPVMRPGQPNEDHNLLPPFFFMDKLREAGSMTRAEFERAAKDEFVAMDTNHDGVLSREEAKPQRGPEPPPPPPNAMFIAAELRFGDKLVTGQPVSAETIIEDTRRLFDGSTVTKRVQGAIYRDAAGRTRREQPLEMIGGFNVVNENNKSEMLVFIDDFATNTQYFLDLANKTARKSPIGHRGPPREGPGEANSESLGTRMIEGVSVEGTRSTFEIPSGSLGNERPIQVITENWFSPELQMIIMSRHLDPLSGEHIFRLTNIRRAETAADLFIVPKGFRIEG